MHQYLVVEFDSSVAAKIWYRSGQYAIFAAMNSKPVCQYMLTVHGEDAMTDCAATFAAHMHGHECILLKGTLGTGKTTFARGFIRALCGDATEVVSPTFMLVQHYDALPEKGGFTVQHYDLYRIEDASELWELGIDEALEQACVLVEWPEIAEKFWPANRVEISIHHDEAQDDSRRLHIAAHGSMVAGVETFCRQWSDAHHD